MLECKAFMYGVDYGSSYQHNPPRMCMTRDSADGPTSGCPGTYFNTDLYVKKYHGQEEKEPE